MSRLPRHNGSPFASALYADDAADMRDAVLIRFDLAMNEARTMRSGCKTALARMAWSNTLTELTRMRDDIERAHIIPKHMDPRVSDAMKERAERDKDRAGRINDQGELL